MTNAHHQIARDFFAALSTGDFPDMLFAPGLTAWTTTSGTQDGAKYLGGVKMLHTLFRDGHHYAIDSLTAEGDRVAAEVQSHGTFINGVEYGNRYVFMLRIVDGRIASVAEHFNPQPVQEKLVPLLKEVMSKQAH